MFSADSKYISDLELANVKEIYFSNYKKLDQIEGKDLILLFGSSKSGKSTFANYMAGCQMENQEESGESLIVPKIKETEFVKIGHGMASETLCPQTIPTKQGFEFCDTPSFDFVDERQDSVKVCGTVLTQLAIKKSKTIKGLIVFIPYNNFSHLDLLYHTMDAVDQLLIEFSKLGQSILFLVTKAPQSTETKHILQKIADFAELEERGGFSKKTARIFHDMIRKNPQCLSFFKPLDEKQREITLHQTQELKPISKSQFKLPIYDAAHRRFKDILLEIITKSTTVFNYRNILIDSLSVNLSEKLKARYSRQLQEIEEDINAPLQADKSDIEFALKVSEFLNLDATIVGPFLDYYKQFKEDYAKTKKNNATPSEPAVSMYGKKIMSFLSAGSSGVFSYINQNVNQAKPVTEDTKPERVQIANPL